MEETFAALTLKVVKPKPKVTANAIIAKKPKAARKLDFEEDTTQYQLITLTAEQIAVKHAAIS